MWFTAWLCEAESFVNLRFSLQMGKTSGEVFVACGLFGRLKSDGHTVTVSPSSGRLSFRQEEGELLRTHGECPGTFPFWPGCG